MPCNTPVYLLHAMQDLVDASPRGRKGLAEDLCVSREVISYRLNGLQNWPLTDHTKVARYLGWPAGEDGGLAGGVPGGAAVRRLWARLAAWWRKRHPWLYAIECPWCRLYDPRRDPEIVGWATKPGSSGICPECKLRMLAEAAADQVEAEHAR